MLCYKLYVMPKDKFGDFTAWEKYAVVTYHEDFPKAEALWHLPELGFVYKVVLGDAIVVDSDFSACDR